MMPVSLKEKLQEVKKQQEAIKPSDWAAMRDEWLNALKNLYNLIEDWFGDYKREGLIEFSRESKDLTEENIGQYTAEKLILKFPNNKIVVIDPIGTILVGAWGRCDIYLLENYRGKYLMLLDKQRQWYLVPEYDKRQRKPLDKTTLEEIFDTWLS